MIEGSQIEDSNELTSLAKGVLNSKWNVYEICQLNFKTVLNNFNVNLELWTNNESKLKELFAPLVEEYDYYNQDSETNPSH